MAFDIYEYLQYIITVIVVWFLWKVVEKVLISRNYLISKNRTLFRFKRKFEIFEFLSNKNPVNENIEILKGITINNQENPIKLQLFLSPSCGYCYTTYKKDWNLLKATPKKFL